MIQAMKTVVTASQLWDGSKLIPTPLVEIEDGQIVWLGPRTEREIPSNARHLDYPGATLAPAFFDVHIHGAAGHDVMEATPEALSAVCSFLASRGTGTFLATTVTAPLDTTLRSLQGIAREIEKSGNGDWRGARPLGIHLEGPFLSHAKRGVHPPEHLLAPDIATFDRLYEAAAGTVKLMTLAPELPGAVELAAHATARGVRVSIGHSNATAAEARQAIAAGACSATHTFNAMRALDHREPGILGTVLTTDTLYAELICDGIHVHPSLVKLWWAAKGGPGSSRPILITDGMSATGMPDGEYLLAGIPVEVADGRASLKGDSTVLAGSVLTLDKALTNFITYTGATVENALPLLTQNPAAMTGLSDSTGTIRVGAPANLLALDNTGSLLASIVNGQVQPPIQPQKQA
jgi:N-acetylglucosamine-6-phosphate deacetylase